MTKRELIHIPVPLDLRPKRQRKYYYVIPQEHEAMLILNIFWGKKLRYRMFCERDNYHILKCKELKWSEANINHFLPYERDYHREHNPNSYYYFTIKCYNEELIKGWTNYPDGNALDGVYQYQQEIKKYRLDQKHERIRQDRLYYTNQLEPLPNDILKWCNEVPLLKYRYIYYKKDKKTIKGYCTYCKKWYTDITYAKHNEYGKCSHCRSKVQFKAIGLKPKIHEGEWFSYIQKWKKGIIVRFLTVDRNLYNFTQSIDTICEESFVFISYTGTTHHFVRNKVNDFEGDWHKCEWTQFSDYNAFLYPKNVSKVIKGTAWQYSALDLFVKKEKQFRIETFVREYLKYPSMEYLIKLGFYNLVKSKTKSWEHYDDTMNFAGKNIHEVLGVDKESVNMLRRINPDIKTLRFYKNCLIKEGVKLSESDIKKVIKFWGDYMNTNTVSFERIVGYDSNISKVIKYVINQAKNGYSGDFRYNNFFGDWLDYIQMAKRQGLNVKDKRIIYPRNLKEAHDVVMLNEKISLNEKYIESFRDIVERCQVYEFTFGNYLIRPPVDMKELLLEGQQLRHCVGNYIPNMAKGETVILLIREVQNPEKPFYTLELKKGLVVQCRGFSNCAMTDDVKKWVDDWHKLKVSEKKTKKKKAG